MASMVPIYSLSSKQFRSTAHTETVAIASSSSAAGPALHPAHTRLISTRTRTLTIVCIWLHVSNCFTSVQFHIRPFVGAPVRRSKRIYQSINQPVNQLINQSINQTFSPSIGQSIIRLFIVLNDRSIKESFN